LILVSGSLSISAAAGEVILRLLGHHGAARSFITNIHPVDDPILDWRYNPKSELKIGKIVYTFNSAGFRDVEHVVEKRPGVSRILVLGDSVTEGTGVASDSVFSRRLQAGLGAKFEVITIAAAGLNTPQEIHLLEQTGLSYQPDLVVLNFILNDCDFYTRYAAARRYMENKDTRIDVLNLPVYPWFKHLLKSSALIYFVRERADILKARIRQPDNRDYFTKIWSFESNRRKVSGGFDELARLTQHGGFDVVGTTADALDLVRMASAYGPDVVVADIQMPPDHADDGLRAALQIRTAQPGTGVRGIYVEIVRALGATPCFQRSNLVPQTIELLAAEEAERGKRVVLIVDEAHLLSPEQLESLRLLGNSEMDSHSPFSCLILGQPTLRRRIRLGTFAALDQRIALRYHLDGMDLAETAGYVKHHVGLAGRSDPLFSDDALALIHQTSRGIPRAINNLAVHSLVAAFADSKSLVDESSARAAVVEVNGD